MLEQIAMTEKYKNWLNEVIASKFHIIYAQVYKRLCVYF